MTNFNYKFTDFLFIITKQIIHQENMIEESKNQNIQGQQDISVNTYTRGKNKFNKSSKEFFEQQQQTCSGKLCRGFNTFTDKAANFLQCTRLFSNQKLDELKYSIENQKQTQDIMESTKSENSQPANADSKVSTKDDLSILKEKQLQEIELPAKNYSIRNVFKFIKRYTEYYDQSYSERQERFGVTFQQVQVQRQEQYQRKLKTFWGQLKRLLLCQGGNELQDLQKNEKQKESSKYSENNSDKISRSMSRIQKKKQPTLHQSESKNDSLLFIQQPRQIEEEAKNQPEDQFQEIKYNKRSKKKPRNMVKVLDKEGQQIKVGQQTKTTQQQDLYKHPNLQYNQTKPTNFRSTYEERQVNEYDYKKAIVNVIQGNGNNIPNSNRNTGNNNDGRQDNINKNINNDNHLNNTNSNTNNTTNTTNNTNNINNSTNSTNNNNNKTNNINNTNNTNNVINTINNKNSNENNQINNKNNSNNMNMNNKTNPSSNTTVQSQQNQGVQKNEINKNIFQFDEELEEDLQDNLNMNQSRQQLNQKKDNNRVNFNNTNGNTNTNANNYDDNSKRQNNNNNSNNSYNNNYNYNYNSIEKDNHKNNQQNNNQSHVNPDTTNITGDNKKFSNTINNFGSLRPKIASYNDEQNEQGDSTGYNQTGYNSNNSQALKKKKKLRAKVNYDLSQIQQPPANDISFFNSNNQALTNQSNIQDDNNDSGALQTKKKKNKRKAHLVIDQGLQQEVIDLEQM